MSNIPDNISKDDIQVALKRIDNEGIPTGARSSTYDVVYEGKHYPPKLLISWANESANGVELDGSLFEGGEDTFCFQLLREEGFIIEKKIDVKSLNILWDQFLEEWPVSRVKEMALPEYHSSGDPDCFCNWIEGGLDKLGSIWGGSAFKFGIYNRADKSEKEPSTRYSRDGDYAWETKYGPTIDEAFEEVKRNILSVISAVNSGTFGVIEDIPSWPVFKWKIAFLYQDRNKPLLPGVFKAEMLAAYLDDSVHTSKSSLTQLYSQVMRNRGEEDLVVFSADIWSIANRRLDAKRFMPVDAEEILNDRYESITEGRKKVIGFLNNENKTIALIRDGKSVRVIMEPWQPKIKGTKIIKIYESSDTRNSNFKTHAPNLAKGNRAVFIECSSRSGFEELLEQYEESSTDSIVETNISEGTKMAQSNQPLNQILYGPPGTGKTYSTIDKALQILEPSFSGTRKEMKQLYDKFVEEEKIAFVTFHQSFSYEDFVEGLKANTNEGKIDYSVERGVFRNICEENSVYIERDSSKSLEILDRRIWKMSLGNTLKDNANIFEESITDGVIRLGYGGVNDFTTSNSKELIQEVFVTAGKDLKSLDYAVTAVNCFRNKMKIGDLVIISDGNLKFRGIAEIQGDYEFSPSDEFEGYAQARKVVWHRVYSPSIPHEKIMNRKFSQATIYLPGEKTIDRKKLQNLLDRDSENKSSAPEDSSNNRKVLIIDEINRGNIASIFGELITLIEPSKRKGQKEAMEVVLPYSRDKFSVPDNLHIIGTMNTADKSLAQVDIALRRRFEFEEMMPDPDLLSDLDEIEGIDVVQVLEVINQRIELLYDREHTVGHSFFMPLIDEPTLDKLAHIFEKQIMPLLEEYFFEDWEKIRQVLGDHLKSNSTECFIQPKYSDSDISKLMGDDWEYEGITSFERNPMAFMNPQAYIGIYSSSKE